MSTVRGSASTGRRRDGLHPETWVIPTRVTAGQVRVARFWVERNRISGEETPEPVRRIASVRIPDDEG